ncbi:DNA-binding protein [Ancylomarina salipaludis]|uniref:DNA-binding protein n=1 Tax=Ancylomarina salipaludis TaxID=2501299 RepID=A0A4Q1JIN4_9BACT|nr:helix-turn-helix domain-containing protein [Ancylomarina salipaludis]RXQ89486.1 DNA-binding protein [Ancylomarina salipaludis]
MDQIILTPFTEEKLRNVIKEELGNILGSYLSQPVRESGKQVLNFEEVRERYGFSKSHLYNLTSKRLIPHSRRGKYLTFSVDQVENWLLENQIPTQEQIDKKADEYLSKKEVLYAK